MQNTIGKIRAAIDKYHMIDTGDHIAVGISGGKDSLFLLSALVQLQEYYPKPFSITALTVDLGFSGKEADYSNIETFCASLSVPYLVRRSRIAPIVFEDRREKNPCSLCAKLRRGYLHTMAKEAGCNKVALGHHYDDVIQTFLMNLFYGGYLGCFAPKTYLSQMDLTVIRPLVFCEEQEILRCVHRTFFPVMNSVCPMDGITSRQKMADLILSLGSQFPDLRTKLMGALQRSGLNGWGL